jgi:hypothetical protein
VIIPNVIVAAGYLEQLVDELVAIAIVSAYYIYIYIYIYAPKQLNLLFY